VGRELSTKNVTVPFVITNGRWRTELKLIKKITFEIFNVLELHVFNKPGIFRGDEVSYCGLLACDFV
jgi:hypothetical protein